MDPKKTQAIQRDQNLLFKKHGFQYIITVNFPQPKVPKLGKFALFILNGLGATFKFKVVLDNKKVV